MSRQNYTLEMLIEIYCQGITFTVFCLVFGSLKVDDSKIWVLEATKTGCLGDIKVEIGLDPGNQLNYLEIHTGLGSTSMVLKED